MIRKSMPSGYDPMGGNRFSEKIMLKQSQSRSVAFLERVTMRNALGLMLASVVTAVVIAGVWFWTSAPRADAAPPQTVAAKPAESLPPAAARLAAKDDVAVTASISDKPAVA